MALVAVRKVMRRYAAGGVAEVAAAPLADIAEDYMDPVRVEEKDFTAARNKPHTQTREQAIGHIDK